LRVLLELLQNERHEAGDHWQDNDLVFPSSRGTPWHQRNVIKYYKRLLQEAGLPDIRFHDLRHTAATLMLQQNISPKVVQEILGHADITLTLNTYSHVSAAMQKEAAAKVDELLTPIDVGEALKRLEEQRAVYQASIETPALPVTDGASQSKDEQSAGEAPLPTDANEQRQLRS
jgi:hypothetical protein